MPVPAPARVLNVTITTPLPSDDENGAFGNRANLLDVSPALLEAYAGAAEEVANQMMPRLGELLKCQPLNAASAACVEPFLTSAKFVFRSEVGDPMAGTSIHLKKDHWPATHSDCRLPVAHFLAAPW
ncbi:MAG: hypothetical protein QOI66_128 [Myxococcales bacterium]|nr:hypothetical protein [Myxococcales bacterium]